MRSKKQRRRRKNWYQKVYLQSEHWREVRRWALARAGGWCERCHRFGGGLEVHHLTYANLGDELQSDVWVLCRECHVAQHRLDQWQRKPRGWGERQWFGQENSGEQSLSKKVGAIVAVPGKRRRQSDAPFPQPGGKLV